MCVLVKEKEYVLIAINHDQNKKRKWFYNIIKVVFANILEEKPIREHVNSAQSEEWYGQFVDFQGDSLPGRAVMRINLLTK